MASDNKTKQTIVSVTDYVDAIADEKKRADAKALIKLMRAATGEKEKMWGPSIIGFGSYHYVYDSGREGDMPLVSFSPRKPAIVFYGLRSAANADALLAKLGKFKSDKGCIYVKALADIDTKILEKLVKDAATAMRKKHAG